MSCHNNNCGCSPSGYPQPNNECCTDVAEYTRLAYSSAQSAYANAQNAEQSAEDAAAALANAVLKTGSTMTGLLILSGDPAVALGAATKQYADTKLALTGGTLSGSLSVPAGATGSQVPRVSEVVIKSGDTMTGFLVLSADPVASLGAATKQYVDTRVIKTGDTMTGSLTVNANVLLNGATSGLGYSTGSGGTVTQTGNKNATVILNRPCGTIVTANSAAAPNVPEVFTLTNSTIAATDTLILNHSGGGSFGVYSLNARCANGSAQIAIRNESGASLSEALTISFVVIKAATS